MFSKIEIPVGDSVELGEHALIAELMRGGLRLLSGSVLFPRAEHIYAGQVERAVGAHRLAQGARLTLERGLIHHMTRQRDAVFAAPAADSVGKGRGKSLGDMVVIAISGNGGFPARQIPEYLGQKIQNILRICVKICLCEIVRPWHDKVVRVGRIVHQRFVRKLRLVCEYRGDSLVELVADNLFIPLVGDLNKALDRIFIERVEIRLTVIPRIRAAYLEIGVPLRALGGVPLADTLAAL